MHPDGFFYLRSHVQGRIQRCCGLLKNHSDFTAAHFAPIRVAYHSVSPVSLRDKADIVARTQGSSGLRKLADSLAQ